MLALTLWRPWTQSILNGPKTVENRTWPPPKHVIGTTICLHAGQKWDDEGVTFMLKQGYAPPLNEHEEPAQAIVGTAKVVRVTKKGEGDLFRAHSTDPFAFGPWCWWLEERRPLPTPIPCPGKQGLWRLAPEMEALVLKMLREAA